MSAAKIWALTHELADALHQVRAAKHESEVTFERFLQEIESASAKQARVARHHSLRAETFERTPGSDEDAAALRGEAESSSTTCVATPASPQAPVEKSASPTTPVSAQQMEFVMKGIDDVVGPKLGASAQGARLKAKSSPSGLSQPVVDAPLITPSADWSLSND